VTTFSACLQHNRSSLYCETPAAAVLVDDDEVLLRMSRRARLAREGYDVLDHHRPDADGLTIVRQMKDAYRIRLPS